MVRNLKEQNYTIVYITNYIDEILMSDKIVVIENGRIINSFAKKEILDQIDFLKEHGIKIPDMVELLYELRKKGVDIEIEDWDKKEIMRKIVGVAK